jgi:hypothetical protein
MRKIVLLAIAAVLGLGASARTVEGAIVPNINSYAAAVATIVVIATLLILSFLRDIYRDYLHRRREQAGRRMDSLE